MGTVGLPPSHSILMWKILIDNAKAIFSLLVECGRGGISHSFLKAFKNAFGPKRQPTQDLNLNSMYPV